MTMQNKVDLAGTDRMVNSSLICCLDLFYFDNLALLRPFTKRRKDGGFVLNAHITAISAVMIARDRIETMIPIFRNQTGHGCGVETRCFGYFLSLCSLGPQFQRFQPGFCTLVLILFARFFDCCYLFFTKYIH